MVQPVPDVQEPFPHPRREQEPEMLRRLVRARHHLQTHPVIKHEIA
jgi:hypothetical protein